MISARMPLPASTLNPLFTPAPESLPVVRNAAGEKAVCGEEATAEQLAALAGGGSLEAFEELARRFEARIYGFLWRQIGNAHDAQDLTQETFVRAWRGISRFDPARDFTTWIFVIARRAAANHFRARRTHHDLSEELPADIENPADAAVARDESADLWRIARKLKPNQREALWLRYGEGFSVAQTARVMGLTTIHVKVILHRARKELARHLERKNL